MPMSHRTDLLTLCAALQEAGIWFSLNTNDALVVGPTNIVKKRPDLLQSVREMKGEIIQLIQESLAYDLSGAAADDPRFERELCPDCQQPCFIVLGPRRLAVHRASKGEVCPGSDRAQRVAVETIMQAFVNDRCVTIRGAVLSWYSIRGALEAWCNERSFFLPPRPFVIEWLDTHFDRYGDDERPMWAGLNLTLPEWGLEEEEHPAPPAVLLMPKQKKKAVLRA